MKKLLTLFTCCLHLALCAQVPYWQQQADHTIDVTLNDTEHTLDGFEKIVYHNNSPDTLSYIWFHCWPNAYRNDQTAFSEQMLQNGRTDFYFSSQEKKGYINRLDFRVDGATAVTEDHPQHIDIVKLILPQPLEPGDSTVITTPFHVQLPFNFSRGGHVKQSYQITQWYPKPAVYDRKGWHPMPYLDQGEFYSDFGNYDVRITVPANYIVAATGVLQDTTERSWLQQKSYAGKRIIQSPEASAKKSGTRKPGASGITIESIPSSTTTKTLRYLQHDVHDFAWFADKRFVVETDTLLLPSGRVIDVAAFYLPSGQPLWKNSLSYLKDAVLSWSHWLGEYPYETVSAVEAPISFVGGMEYPTITSISPMPDASALETTIAHEVGHNWFYGVLASDERTCPWLDEGFNTYYDTRYHDRRMTTAGTPASKGRMTTRSLPLSLQKILLATIEGIKKDQPVNTPADAMTRINYALITYFKTAEWLKQLEAAMGKTIFDSAMRTYFSQWQFRHPYPEDFKRLVDSMSARDLNPLFEKLSIKGSLDSQKAQKKIRPAFIFSLRDTKSTQYISFLPAVGANLYDGLMIGGMMHNYQLPLPGFRFLVAPLYGTSSRKLNGLARASYSWFPDRSFYRINVGAAASKFSMDEYRPEGMKELKPGFTKLVPFVRLTLNEGDPRSRRERYVQFKSYFIHEERLRFDQQINGNDTAQLVRLTSGTRQLNQLKFVMEDHRVLYPYKAGIQLEQHKDFLRAALTATYFFNYANREGGLNLRFFAGKFVYLGTKTLTKQFGTERYHLNLSAPNGYEDYTYSDYFAGRNELGGWTSQQMIMRDGGFKVRTDLLSNKVGKTDDWLVAANFVTDIPKGINPLQLLPFEMPVRLFADVGTYADAWNEDAGGNRFLFDAGFQISFAKETVNIYIPVLYSQVYRDYFRSTLGPNRFWKTISFSIDIQNFNLKKFNRDIPL